MEGAGGLAVAGILAKLRESFFRQDVRRLYVLGFADAWRGWSFLPSSVVRSSISPVAIFPIMTAAPITSAGRFSPFGPRGMSLSPDNSFRFFEDFYAVPSTASESNEKPEAVIR